MFNSDNDTQKFINNDIQKSIIGLEYKLSWLKNTLKNDKTKAHYVENLIIKLNQIKKDLENNVLYS